MDREDELKKGFIVPFLTSIFDIFGHITIVTGRPWTAKFVEVYVLLYLFFELSFLGLLVAFPNWSNNRVFFVIIPILFGYRILDIIRAAFFWLILSPYRGGKRWVITSTPRLLVLNIINYLELWVIFGVIAFLARDGFNPQFQSVWDSCYYCISVISLFGSNVEPVSIPSRIIFVSGIGLGLLFILLIIARAISLLPNIKN